MSQPGTVTTVFRPIAGFQATKAICEALGLSHDKTITRVEISADAGGLAKIAVTRIATEETLAAVVEAVKACGFLPTDEPTVIGGG